MNTGWSSNPEGWKTELTPTKGKSISTENWNMRIP